MLTLFYTSRFTWVHFSRAQSGTKCETEQAKYAFAITVRLATLNKTGKILSPDAPGCDSWHSAQNFSPTVTLRHHFFVHLDFFFAFTSEVEGRNGKSRVEKVSCCAFPNSLSEDFYAVQKMGPLGLGAQF